MADPEDCRRACEGIDTVVHLAADASPEADFHGSLLDADVKGAFNVFRAAADAGCRRVVYASSAQVIEGYPKDRPLTTRDPVRPGNLHGVTKCFGEARGSYFASQEGLSVIAVRIANFNDFAPGQQHTPRTWPPSSAVATPCRCCFARSRRRGSDLPSSTAFRTTATSASASTRRARCRARPLRTSASPCSAL